MTAAVVLVVWLVAAVVVAVGVGRTVRLRDRQTPRDSGVVPDL